MENISTLQEKSTTPKLSPGIHPGFDHLSPQVNVCRCKLWPVTTTQEEQQADYAGLLWLVPEKEAARVFLWCHGDGTLGLRVQKLQKLPQKFRPKPQPKKKDGYEEALAKIEALKNKKASAPLQ